MIINIIGWMIVIFGIYRYIMSNTDNDGLIDFTPLYIMLLGLTILIFEQIYLEGVSI